MGFLDNLENKLKEFANNSRERTERRREEFINKQKEKIGYNGIRGKLENMFNNPFKVSVNYLASGINPLNFICPHCLKTIIIDNISSIKCPHCDSSSVGAICLFRGCPTCGGIIKYYECPHCKEPIDLLADYNEEELIKRRLK